LNLFQKTALVQDFPLFFAQRRNKICQKKNSLIEYGPAFHGKLEQWLSALDGNFEQNHEK
jgi:hypothetical protein